MTAPARMVGDARVPRRSFELRLGDHAVLVWSYLCRLRDYFGTVTVTVPGICKAKGFAKMKERTVKRALARLREAGLVKDLGFVWRRTESGPRKVYVREVYGGWAGREHVLVPTDVWGSVMKLPAHRNHGGKREGAGVKKIQTTASEEVARHLRANLANAYRSWAATGKARPAFDDTHGFSYQLICESLGHCPGARSAWHIDHAKPLARFDLTQHAHVLEAMSPQNHQWLPARVNLQKGAKLDWVHQSDGEKSIGKFGANVVAGPRSSGFEEMIGKFGANVVAGPRLNGPNGGHDQAAPLSSSLLGSGLKELVSSLRSETPAAKKPAAGTVSRVGKATAETTPRADPVPAPIPVKQGPEAVATRPQTPPVEGQGGPALPQTVPSGAPVPPPTRADRLRAIGAAAVKANRQPVFCGHNGIPAHPTADETAYLLPPPPRVPSFEELPDQEIRDAQLAFCAKWYQSAVESRVGKTFPIRMAGETRKYFEDALDIFLKHDIRPGVWTAWALDRILLKLPTNARRRFRPQVKMLLSPKTLTESRWLHREEAGEYATVAVVTTRAGAEFSRRFRLMFDDVLHGTRERAENEAIARANFPEGIQELRQELREKSARLGQVVLSKIREGRWVWELPKALRE